jgi:phospholipase C
VVLSFGATLVARGAAEQPVVTGATDSSNAIADLTVHHAEALAATAVTAQAVTPIKHVVFIDQENHSFDNVLGKVCKVRVTPCDGATSGKLGSQTIALSQATDIVQNIGHSTFDQPKAVDGGKMDHFDQIMNCAVPNQWRCYSQYSPGQIPNVTKLANTFGVSDRTFSQGLFASSMQHLELLDGGITDGFVPDFVRQSTGPGWGCDSGNAGLWRANSTAPGLWERFCVPAPAGSKAALAEPPAIQNSPVKSLPTILDRLEAAGRTWKIYADTDTTKRDYSWATCPMYAECFYGPQRTHMVPSRSIVTDAAKGTLPSFSLLLPSGGVTGETAQHNFDSMKAGDNWLGQVVTAIEKSPDWSSTAIFLTYDDCGCFYDHVTPPSGLGIRVPMIVISPYVKPHYTDSQTASFTSVIAFTERIFGLQPLTLTDALSYAYLQMFNWSQTPLQPAALVNSPIPAASVTFLSTHKPNLNDPT